MAVRRINSASTDRLNLGGSGAGLAGWGLMVLANPRALTGTQPFICFGTSTSTSIGVLYYDATNGLSFGSASGDDWVLTPFTITATDWWLLGFTKAAGTTACRFHAYNVTAGGATTHAAGHQSQADVAGNWTRTEIGAADGGTFLGDKYIAAAAGFTSVYSDADFNAVVSALTTASIHGLAGIARLWDFNQAATSTHVNNLETSTDDQVSITATSVITGSDPSWTFGLGGAPAPIVSPLVVSSAASYAAHRAASI